MVETRIRQGRSRACLLYTSTPPGLSEAYVAFSVTRPNNYSPWMGTVVKALNASDGIHKQAFDPMSCVYRRIYSYVALSPEVTCDLAETRIDKRLPSLPDFARIVLPAVVKREMCIRDRSTAAPIRAAYSSTRPTSTAST